VLGFGRGKWFNPATFSSAKHDTSLVTDDLYLAELACRSFTMHFIDHGIGLAFYQQLHAAISAICFNFPLCDMPRIGEYRKIEYRQNKKHCKQFFPHAKLHCFSHNLFTPP
jgi:hypothetical protein